MQDGLLWLIGERHIFKPHFAANRPQRYRSPRIALLIRLGKNLAGTIQTRDRFGQLRPYSNNLHHGSNQIGQNHRIGDIIADRQMAGNDHPRAEIHDQCSHRA